MVAPGEIADAITAPGELVGPVTVGPVAHGGHCVARHDGRVIFVRHALPGEIVRVAVTDTSHDRFWRGDAVEILEPTPERVEPPCPIAGPGRCGGCDWQHASLPAQRELKAAVVAEQLQRLAGIDRPVVVQEVPGATDGLGWRRRMRYHVDAAGRPGLRRHRSHQVEPLSDQGCSIADPRLAHPPAGVAGAELVGTAGDDRVGWDGDGAVTYRAVGRSWRVTGDGFWQTHPAAADVLVDAVLVGLRPREGERALDLYAGAGLFSGALAEAGCRVTAVEGSRGAVADARHNLADLGDRVQLVAGDVGRVLRDRRTPRRVDLVVLDPPRTGAGKDVVRAVLDRRPRAVAYVACDPAALARDLGYATRAGWRLTELEAYDLFPMTQHVECVAVLEP